MVSRDGKVVILRPNEIEDKLIAGIEHVRETIPFPRMLYRLRP